MADARDVLRDFLNYVGLPDEESWVMEQIIEGRSPEGIMLDLIPRPSFQARFPAYNDLVAKGRAMSVDEMLAYEKQTVALMRNAGMPEGFWDQPEDIANLMRNEVSLNELNQRIADAYTTATMAPPDVQNYFGETYGAFGPTALATYFLDPDRATPTLQRQLATAEVGGYGRTFGFNVAAPTAERVAATGVRGREAQQGFEQLDRTRSLYDETISESEDYLAEEEGVEATFGLGNTAAQRVARRLEERQARFGGGAGGAITQEGALTARRAGR